MNRVMNIFQRILRIIMLVVAIGLVLSAIFLVGVHMANRNLPKTEVQGVIVRGNSARWIHEVEYTFEGQTHVRRPLDVYFRALGDTGKTVTVYVANDHPDRTFMTPHGDELMESAGFMGGWGLLLFVILLGERQLLQRIKVLEENTKKEE